MTMKLIPTTRSSPARREGAGLGAELGAELGADVVCALGSKEAVVRDVDVGEPVTVCVGAWDGIALMPSVGDDVKTNVSCVVGEPVDSKSESRNAVGAAVVFAVGAPVVFAMGAAVVLAMGAGVVGRH